MDPDNQLTARAWHLLTAVVATFAVVLQLVLVCQGNSVLDETSKPDLATRVIRFASYLTIWSNVLVAWSSWVLARNPGLVQGSVWRALRLNAVIVCFGGGIVHFFFLRPILNLSGGNALADHLLHQVVPLLAVISWLLVGPRLDITWGDFGPFLVLPMSWIAYTLVRGVFVDWYPYPFIDVLENGYGVVALNAVGVGLFMAAQFALAKWLDPKLPGLPVAK